MVTEVLTHTYTTEKQTMVISLVYWIHCQPARALIRDLSNSLAELLSKSSSMSSCSSMILLTLVPFSHRGVPPRWGGSTSVISQLHFTTPAEKHSKMQFKLSSGNGWYWNQSVWWRLIERIWTHWILRFILCRAFYGEEAGMFLENKD